MNYLRADLQGQRCWREGWVRDSTPTPAEPPLDPLRVAMLWRLHPRTAARLQHRLKAGTSLDHILANLESLGYCPRTREALASTPSRDDARRLAARLRQIEVSFQITGEPGFPARLESIPDAPPYVFLRGPCWDSSLPRPVVGIVGSRAASRSGREISRTLARDLALAGCSVVSGLARGIDAECHRGALAADGCTVGVLGAGLDIVYPPEHEDLQSRMLVHGGLISEFPPGTPPLPLHFPRRNRILAGLVDVLVVVEGTERSGARSTVDHALDQAREVLAVPRDPVIPGSALPNRLLFEGARPALSARDIMEAAGWDGIEANPARSKQGLPARTLLRDRRQKSGQLAGSSRGSSTGPARASGEVPTDAPLSRRLLAALRSGPLAVDQLCLELSVPVRELQAALAELQVLGWIEGDQGRYQRR